MSGYDLAFSLRFIGKVLDMFPVFLKVKTETNPNV